MLDPTLAFEYVASNWLQSLKQQIRKDQFYFVGEKEGNVHAKDLHIHIRSDQIKAPVYLSKYTSCIVV